MNEILVAGHKSPDTDSIGSAIACAYLYTETGRAAKAVRAGEINKETRFALRSFGLTEPPLCTEFAAGQQVVLVDHNERKQSIDGVRDADVVALIDHHRLGDFETEKPIFISVEPVGCTATILFRMFERAQVHIPQEIAGMMLSAIISDTLLFRSPTCTERDKLAVKALAKLADVDYEEYGMNMLKAGADVSDIPVEQWVQTDKKEFMAGEQTFSVAQLSVMDTAPILARRDELHRLMEADRSAHGYLASFLMVTDILQEETELLFVGGIDAWVARAFATEPRDGSVHLPGVMSRKKQIVPPLLGAV